MTNTTFTNLRRERISRGLTTVALAAQVPCSRMTIHRLEREAGIDAHAPIQFGLERELSVPFETLTQLDTENAPVPEDEGAEVPNVPATNGAHSESY